MTLTHSLQTALLALAVSSQPAPAQTIASAPATSVIDATATAPAPGQSRSQSGDMHLTLTPTVGSLDALQPGEIRVLDNGAPLQPVALHPQGSSAPTHVILVIDDVNARISTIAYERDQLKKFFTRNDGQLKVPFSIAVMTDTKTEIQPGFSQNGNAENDILQQYKIGLHTIRRDSQYGGFDRTGIGIRTLLQLVQYAGTIPGPKLILFVSPGWPLLSGPGIQLPNKEQSELLNTLSRLQNALLRSNTTIDMVNPFGPAENLIRADYYESFLKGVKKPADVDIADLSLQVLAVHSGGTVLQGTSDIGDMVDRTVSGLDHGYTLSFQPATGGEQTVYHRLQVQVNRPGTTVHAPDEYYQVPPAEGDR